MNKLVFSFGILLASSSLGQSIQDVPVLNQIDTTTFELNFKTDTAAIVTVHAAEDTTYRSAFIFLGRTVGDENRAIIKLEGLRNNAHYVYRIFLGTERSPFNGKFQTGNLPRK